MRITMKTVARVVGLVILGTAVAGTQPISAPPTTVESTTNAAGPKIQFETPIYDFGKVRSGEPIKHTFVFTNTGDGLLILNAVQPQCGCTTAGEWTKQVEPGNTGSIPIQVNTYGYNGTVIKQVTVTCNVKTQATVFLQLKGTLYKPIDFSPPMAVINIAPDSDSGSVLVTITNNTEDPLMLSSPESNNRLFSAQLTTNEPGKAYQLKVTIAPPMPAGSVQAQINLRTGWTNPVVLTIPAIASVQPSVMVIPSYVTLPAGPLVAGLTNSVAIENRSTNALELSEPLVNVPGVEARIKEVRPGYSFAAMLEFPQGFEVPPGRQVELSVKSSNPRFPVVKVPVLQMPRPVRLSPQGVPVMPGAPAVTPPKMNPQATARPRPMPPPLPPSLPVGH